MYSIYMYCDVVVILAQVRVVWYSAQVSLYSAQRLFVLEGIRGGESRELTADKCIDNLQLVLLNCGSE